MVADLLATSLGVHGKFQEKSMKIPKLWSSHEMPKIFKKSKFSSSETRFAPNLNFEE